MPPEPPAIPPAVASSWFDAAPFLWSVLAGLISAAAFGFGIWLIRVIWLSKIYPWWKNEIYSDARVEGLWETTLETDGACDYREHATIKQTGHNVDGTIVCVSGPDNGRSYELKGMVKNTIFSAVYWNKSRTALDSGTFSLRLESNGEELIGHTIYYFDKDHTLVSRRYRWRRLKADDSDTTVV